MKNSTSFLFLLLCALTVVRAQSRIQVSTSQELLSAISQARQQPGRDTLYIHINPGIYMLSEPIMLTAEDTRPIVFEGDASNKPLISAGRRIKGWTLTPEGWWTCHIPETVRYNWFFEQLYVHGKRATRARTPDDGYFTVTDASEDIHLRGIGRVPLYATQCISTAPENLKSLRYLTEPQRPDFIPRFQDRWDSKDVIARFYHKWDNTVKPIQYALPDSGRFYITGTGMLSWNAINKGTRFFLENYREALNAPGEWFLDEDGNLTYIPREGEKIETAECYAPVLRQALVIKGNEQNPVTDKVFRNIIFAHAASYTPRPSGTEPAQVACPVDATIMMDYAQRITIDNCEIRHTGNYAIWVREKCHDNCITNTFVYDSGAGGIKIGDYRLPDEGEEVTDNTLVQNCILRHMGLTFPCAGGIIIFHSAHNKILHNEICDLRYTGVSVGWVWGYTRNPAFDNEVGFNHIHHIGWGELSDMGAVYTLGCQPGTRIHDNVIHDIWSYDYGGWGLYTDEGSTGIVMENNLVYNTKCGAFMQHYGRDNIIRNNIFAWNTLQQAQYARPEEHRSFTFQHNIILKDRGDMLTGAWENGIADIDWNCYYDITGAPIQIMNHDFAEWKQKKEPHSINSNPLFRDPKNGDYRFSSLKTARKIGFKPFDMSQAGVQGNEEWKQKAQMLPEEIEAFNLLSK